jgi:hypothetical protein
VVSHYKGSKETSSFRDRFKLKTEFYLKDSVFPLIEKFFKKTNFCIIMSSFLSTSNAAEDSTWVNFNLGEDVRSASRLQQDENWKSAVADGRVHISHREANQV